MGGGWLTCVSSDGERRVGSSSSVVGCCWQVVDLHACLCLVCPGGLAGLLSVWGLVDLWVVLGPSVIEIWGSLDCVVVWCVFGHLGWACSCSPPAMVCVRGI